ncbi:sugar ABC transporter substrate-binding protein [Plantibacter sp. PA-3-X8]|uniref:ABC transporter substrate-binding protein n=1 Tax=unclassified Plantibacter TaxID=2624265 RepID=UPI0006F562D5|nr:MULTISPECIES: sugar ABC transporter substrate-binding protein [unclassified Plantibacter]AZH84778.1 sugar ABC transporter substrate-binding protein [Plantibacter sp. PA-3-X8]KQM17850.1 sugar ABC transporter substrate-binding protein [Plantibacter sp. Leaf1]KQR60747.1 sugar ABC transporter substrate-binding protein [Plantibacter sp. Leaf171]MBD8518926.1 sugar ABC transporter substrate-binding protein [Plantibacter sp. CFBP 8804]
MKRQLMAGAAMAGVLALTACSGGSATGSQTAESLVWSMWIAGQEDQAAWQTVADEVKSSDKIDVTIQGAPFSDYWTKLRTQLSAGTAPCIVTVQSLRAANYTDVLLPLDDLAKSSGTALDEFDATALDAMKVDGKLYALPYDTGPLVMFYNKDLFAEAGVAEPKPGWTVDDFEAAGEALKSAGKQLYAPSAEDLYLESMILSYNGGRVVSEDGSLDVTNAKFAAGLEWIAGLVKDGYATPASADSSADDNAFINGQAATYVDGPWSLINTKAKATFDVGVVTLPAGSAPTTFSAGSGFGVSKECKYPEQAYQAITTMTSEDVLSTLGKEGRAFPARTTAQGAWFDNAGIDGVEESFAAAQDGSVPLPGNKNSDQLAQLMSQYAIQAMNGQQSGAEVLDQISSQLPK